MRNSADPPRWQALQIGPGGLPADQVRPVGPGTPVGPGPANRAPTGHGASVDVLPPLWQNWAARSTPVPPRRGPSNATIAKVVAALAVIGVVIGLGVWANRTSPLNASGNTSRIAVGQCLSSSGQRIAGEVDCASGAADFAVVGRYSDTSDASACSASPSDVAVVLSGPTVLCLDYVAVVGDCLFAGRVAVDVGKVDCGSSEPGVYRVTAVLRNSIDPDSCPAGTAQTLVHRYNSEVICLASA